MKAKQTLQMYYGFSLITAFGVAFIASSYVMYLRQAGLGLMQTNMVNFFFYASVFIFEVPTGAVADVFGRKISYVVSCLLLGVSFMLYSQARSFAGFAAAEVIGGIGVTFCSGAFDAWLVDRLKQLEHQFKLEEVIAREQRFSLMACMAGSVLGAKVAESDMRTPWMVAGLVQMLVGVAAAVLMEEDGFERKKLNLCEGWKSMKRTVVASFAYAREQKQVRFLLMIGVLMTLALQAPNMQWQPFFGQLTGEQVSPMGWIFALMMLGSMIGSMLIKRFKMFCADERKALLFTQMGIGVAVMATAYLKWLPAALTVFLVHEMFRGIYWPIKEAFMHDNIPSSERATIVSVDSMLRQIGGMIGLVLSGAMAKYTSLSFTWVVFGALLFFAAFRLLKNGRP